MTTDVRMRGLPARTSVAAAEALIAARVSALGPERVPFSRSLGRILAEALIATADVPPHPKSAMDGFAVRAADLPGRLRVVGEQLAADDTLRAIGASEAVRTMTGARIAGGADAVVMVERTRTDGAHVDIDEALVSGTHVIARGEDIAAGQAVLSPGRRVRAQDLSLMATLGALEVAVVRRPRVRIVPTGSELVIAGSAARGAAVIESNSYMIGALAERDGAQVEVHPIVRDDVAALERAVALPGADLVVITAGSSVGAQDFSPQVVRQLGELPVHGVHLRPAAPTGIGFTSTGTVVLLAPGFPGAAMVAWDLFGRTIVQRMLGLTPAWPYRTVEGRLAAAYTKPAERTELVRARREGDLLHLLPGGGARLSAVTQADGFVVFEAGPSSFAAGSAHALHCYA